MSVANATTVDVIVAVPEQGRDRHSAPRAAERDRPELTRGDVLVLEWQPLRESYTTPGRKVRPVTVSHFPASWRRRRRPRGGDERRSGDRDDSHGLTSGQRSTR